MLAKGAIGTREQTLLPTTAQPSDEKQGDSVSGPLEVDAPPPGPLAPSGRCPRWCSTRHGASLGEEDWIHVGEPLTIADGTLAQLCMSIDPDTGAADGPYVLIGSAEYSLAEAEALGSALLTLAAAGTGSGKPRA
jgi:hypothetical protein